MGWRVNLFVSSPNTPPTALGMHTGALRQLLSPLASSAHKGQNGRVGVIGGCLQYTGAPYYAASAALNLGADLAYIFCTPDAAIPIKCYSPELIVLPFLVPQNSLATTIPDAEMESHSAVAWEKIKNHFSPLHSLVIGPGLGRDPFVLRTVELILEHSRTMSVPVVCDGDCLYHIARQPQLVKNSPLFLLTPNIREFYLLLLTFLTEEEARSVISPNSSPEDERLHRLQRAGIQLVEQLNGPSILLKGEVDLFFPAHAQSACHSMAEDRSTASSCLLLEVDELSSRVRCGGQGDIVAGLCGSIMAQYVGRYGQEGCADQRQWADALLEMVQGASSITRKAAYLAYIEYGRSSNASRILDCIPAALRAAGLLHHGDLADDG